MAVPVLSEWRTDSELRLMLSLAIVRAVNGLVDPLQQSYFAGSVLTLAAKMGIPGWIVELRHDATHNELPSLSVLRRAGRCLLAWYERNYWQQQADYLNEINRCLFGGEGHAATRERPTNSVSFSSVVIPHIINEVIFFEMEPPVSSPLFNKFRSGKELLAMQELSLFFCSTRWRQHVDVLLQNGPNWTINGLIGHATYRIISLAREIDSEDALSDWRVFLLTAMLGYLITIGKKSGEWRLSEFETEIFEKNAKLVPLHQKHLIVLMEKLYENMGIMLVPKAKTFEIAHSDSEGELTGGASRTRVRLENFEKDVLSSCSLDLFEPVLWPLGSMPGKIEFRLCDVEVIAESDHGSNDAK